MALGFSRRGVQPRIARGFSPASHNLCDAEEMARAVAQYVFAALLALLSTPVGVPSVRVVSAIEIVWCAEAEHQTPAEAVRIKPDRPVTRFQPAYASRTLPAPDVSALFQRPPPPASSCS